MELKISKTGDVITVLLEGKIDANVSINMEQELLSLISEDSPKVIADLSNVVFISSAGLRALISALKEAKRRKGDLRLVGIEGHVKEVFEITGFSTIFKIYTTSEDAVRSFGD